MAVNYFYANPVGYYTETQRIGNEVKEYKISMLRANCLWANLYFYKDENGQEMEQFISFYHDLAHLACCIQDHCLDEQDDFHFYFSALAAYHWSAIKLLVDAGKRVTIENHGNGLYELPVKKFSAKEITKDTWPEIHHALAEGFNAEIC